MAKEEGRKNGNGKRRILMGVSVSQRRKWLAMMALFML